MAKMKAVQIPKAGAAFEIVERDIPQPDAGQVRIRVQACGICHSDVISRKGRGLFPGITYPRVPGHEVAGVIDELGVGVKEWQKGQRVGVGWHGGQDGTCLACRRGDFVNCANVKICGVSYDGGYQEYMVAPVEALAQMPEIARQAGRSCAADVCRRYHVAPNSLRHSGALPRVTSSRSKESAVSGIWGIPVREEVPDIESQPLGGDRGMPRSPKSSVRMSISIAPQLTPQQSCRNLAERV